MNKHRQREGYVLILTLFIIAMVGIFSVSAARFSLNKGVDATLAQSRAQAQWGVASCQRMALENSSRLLSASVWDEDQEQFVRKSLPAVSFGIELGGQQVEVLLSDESSKLDLNRASSSVTLPKVKSIARELLSDSSVFTIKLRPMAESRTRSVAEAPLGSWGQVLVHQKSGQQGKFLVANTRRMTLWGRQVNIKTAPDDVLYQACKLEVGANIANEIVANREEDPTLDSRQLVTSTQANENQSSRLNEILTDSSRAQAVWISLSENSKTSYFLSVREYFSGSLSRIYSFKW